MTADIGISVNEMPQILRDLTTFANRWPAMETWRRVRFAVTQAEHDAIREYFKNNGSGYFAAAVRGVPLQIEDVPFAPAFAIETFHLNTAEGVTR